MKRGGSMLKTSTRWYPQLLGWDTCVQICMWNMHAGSERLGGKGNQKGGLMRSSK